MKRILIFLTSVMMVLQLGSATNVSVDGTNFDGAKVVNSVTYVPLRKFTQELSDVDVTWNGKTSTATAEGDGYLLAAQIGKAYIECNGRYIYSGSGNMAVDGSIYVPVRSVAKTLGAKVDWNGATKTAVVTSDYETFENADDYYDANDLYWLSKIINAESEGESLIGKIAVGNVVLNRVKSADFPNTVYDVIFDRKGGVQFTPTENGSINKEPNEESIIAAKICLENYKLSNKNILFFLNPTISTSTWVPNNRDFVMTIGRHDFYA